MPKTHIPFHRHDFSESEIRAVTRILKGKWITGGPENVALEEEVGRLTEAQETLSLSSATAGLFLALKLFGIKPGDEVITSPYTFAATANVICACGADPVFADISPDYNLDPESVARKVTPQTKAIIAVDYGGYPCDYHSLRKNSGTSLKPNNIYQEALGRPLILADSAHSIGTVPRRINQNLNRKQKKADSLSHYQLSSHFYADIHCYSFHAVKNITCGEGGILCFMNNSLIQAGMEKHMRQASLHGLDRDAYYRNHRGSFFYDMKYLGYKYNSSEIAAALARAQLKRLKNFEKKKYNLKKYYDKHFQALPGVKFRPESPTWIDWQIHPHLYTLEWEKLANSEKKNPLLALSAKEKFFQKALNAGLSLNFHYLPIPLLTYYQRQGYSLSGLPITTSLYPRHFSLPFFSSLTKSQASQVVSIITQLMTEKK